MSSHHATPASKDSAVAVAALSLSATSSAEAAAAGKPVQQLVVGSASPATLKAKLVSKEPQVNMTADRAQREQLAARQRTTARP